MDPTPEDHSHLWRDEMQFEPELSQTEREIRDRFVEEYLVDRNPFAAALRVGYMSSFALEMGKRFLQESYVQREIKKREMPESQETPEEKDVHRKRILASLHREAHYYGPGASHAARVTALTKLASYYGVDHIGEGDEDESGGVMVVPGHDGIDDWEAAAAKSQEELAADVRT